MSNIVNSLGGNIQLSIDTTISFSSINSIASILTPPLGCSLIIDNYSGYVTTSFSGSGVNLQIGDNSNSTKILSSGVANFLINQFITSSQPTSTNMPACYLSANSPLLISASGSLTAGDIRLMIQYRLKAN